MLVILQGVVFAIGGGKASYHIYFGRMAYTHSSVGLCTCRVLHVRVVGEEARACQRHRFHG